MTWEGFLEEEGPPSAAPTMVLGPFRSQARVPSSGSNVAVLAVQERPQQSGDSHSPMGFSEPQSLGFWSVKWVARHAGVVQLDELLKRTRKGVIRSVLGPSLFPVCLPKFLLLWQVGELWRALCPMTPSR